MKEGMKILVAYDGSDHAKRALSEAVDIAKKFSGSVTVLHVFWDKPKEYSQNLLKETEERLKKAKIKYNLTSVRGQNIPGHITQISAEEEYDLIAIGSRGFGVAKVWMIGSVSSKVIEDATCPVLVVK